MNDMKCPFCQQELDYLAEDIYGNMYCPNCRDKNGFTYKASESIWQELIRTRKALDIAIERLEQIAHESFQGDQQSINMGFHIRAAAALTDIEQITALEQKDIK